MSLTTQCFLVTISLIINPGYIFPIIMKDCLLTCRPIDRDE